MPIYEHKSPFGIWIRQQLLKPKRTKEKSKQKRKDIPWISTGCCMTHILAGMLSLASTLHTGCLQNRPMERLASSYCMKWYCIQLDFCPCALAAPSMEDEFQYLWVFTACLSGYHPETSSGAAWSCWTSVGQTGHQEQAHDAHQPKQGNQRQGFCRYEIVLASGFKNQSAYSKILIKIRWLLYFQKIPCLVIINCVRGKIVVID